MSSEWRSCWRGTITWTITRRAWGKLRTPARKLRSRPGLPLPPQQGMSRMQAVPLLRGQQVRSQHEPPGAPLPSWKP